MTLKWGKWGKFQNECLIQTYKLLSKASTTATYHYSNQTSNGVRDSA